MPIPVVCQGCQVRLNAPDAAAGKRVRCPKCQAAIAIPAPLGKATPEPTALPEPAPVSRKLAAPQPQPDQQPSHDTGSPFDFGDSDMASSEPLERSTKPAPGRSKGYRPSETEREESAPSSYRRKQPPTDGTTSGRSRTLLYVGGGVLALCCVGGAIAAGVYFIKKPRDTVKETPKEPDKPGRDTKPDTTSPSAGAKAAVPVGWKEFRPPDGSFKAYFPELPEGEPPADTENGAIYGGTTADESLGAAVVVFHFPASMSIEDRRKALDKPFTANNDPTFKVLSQKTVTWLGGTVTETLTEEAATDGKSICVWRYIVKGQTGYLACVTGKNTKPKPEFVNGFFDNIDVQK